MMRRSVRTILGMIFLALFQLMQGVSPAFCWNELGHRLIARIAEKRLTSDAYQLVQKILGNQSLTDIAIWADKIKQERPETAPWHWITFEHAEPWKEAQIASDTTGNLLTAIELCRQELIMLAASDTERREALMFLVHFVGDLHQPLHCAPEGDEGGNTVKVLFLGQEVTLHRLWDSGLINHTGLTEEEYLHGLEALAIPDRQSFPTHPDCPLSWARESNKESILHAYAMPENHQLNELYYENNIRVINRQLLLAGERLARTLNQLANDAKASYPAMFAGGSF